MRLAISQVEEALRNPDAWARKLESDSKDHMTYSRANAVLHTIEQYHKHGDDDSFARSYLSDKLGKFKEGKQNDESREQVDWYIEEWEARARSGWVYTKVNLTVAVPCPIWTRDEFRCTGRVSRFDVDPGGGYAAWLMTQSSAAERLASIEPLLVQYAVAEHLNVPTKDVRVGVYGFKDRFVASSCGDDTSVREARDEFWKLLLALKMDKQP